MAVTNAVWGIDIGHCALKALRCEYDVDNRVLVATAFDYIEYPKILSQPDANPKELTEEALEQFLSRNKVRGDHVAMSVPGQHGLARFFQPPPVDVKKLPEIVRYEAKQVIPFPLEEVIWDYQQMAGGTEVEGFIMETEIGLFAMKRDQVFESIEPFVRRDVELDVVQLAPLCAFNFVAHNLLFDTIKDGVYDPDNPPESFVILSVGTDTTDLVITNGFRVWQRNIPLGGNHFTKQLTKELKLTFAKAEHLKRNVRDADDAKAVIQAMRPVFNDLLSEVQRSIGFFQNLDRKSDIAGMIMLGNAMKLPGLQQYLSKNLGYELINVDHERWAARLAGQAVLSSPQFKDNMLAFGVCYGLCLQGLGQARLTTNLLPRELLRERMMRAKKPWAVATAASLMLAFAVNFFFEYREWYKVHPQHAVNGVTWEQAMKDSDTAKSQSDDNEKKDSAKISQLNKLTALGKELSGNADRRLLWLEVLRAVNQALPRDEDVAPQDVADFKVKPISQRQELHIEYVDNQYFPDLKMWFSEDVKRKYQEELARLQSAPASSAAPAATLDTPAAAPGTPAATPGAAAAPGTPAAAPGTPAAPGTAAAPGAPAAPAAVAPAGQGAPPGGPPAGPPAAPPATPPAGKPAGGSTATGPGQDVTGPSGPGWVFEIKGYHYYNEDPLTWGGTHVRNTLLKNLRELVIELPTGPGRPPEKFSMEELGIGFPILAVESRIVQDNKIKNPFFEGPDVGPGAMPGAMPGYGMMGAMTGPGLAPSALGAAAEPEGAAKKKPTDEASNPRYLPAPLYRFVVQFCWRETQLSERLEKRAQQAAGGTAPAGNAAGGTAAGNTVAVTPTGG